MVFKEGKSGNPEGTKTKPKEGRVSTWLLKELDKQAKLDENTKEGYESMVTNAQLLAEKIVKRALSDDDQSLAYIKEVLDRTEGKPKQSTDITSKGEKIVMPILGGESQLSTDGKDNE